MVSKVILSIISRNRRCCKTGSVNPEVNWLGDIINRTIHKRQSLSPLIHIHNIASQNHGSEDEINEHGQNRSVIGIYLNHEGNYLNIGSLPLSRHLLLLPIMSIM